MQHVKNFLEPREQKRCRKMQKNRSQLLVAGPPILILDPRSYLEIETLRGKNPTEFLGVLSEDCGEFTMDRSTVSC